ncbi:hypothetical protein GUITHDRAFT_69534, partial [Guillardia theta CCMP2712]
PQARNCHTATMVGDKMLVFGGFGGSKWFEELWVFDTPSIEWHKPELQSSAMEGTAHTANIVGSKMYIFGGNNGSYRMNDFYSLDTQVLTMRQ